MIIDHQEKKNRNQIHRVFNQNKRTNKQVNKQKKGHLITHLNATTILDNLNFPSLCVIYLTLSFEAKQSKDDEDDDDGKKDETKRTSRNATDHKVYQGLLG